MSSDSLDRGLDEIIKRRSIVFSDKGLNDGGKARNGGVHGRRVLRNQPSNGGKGSKVNRNDRGGACKIIISNLADTVSSSDLQQLFEDDGGLELASPPVLHYDADGCMLGTAEISLRCRADADGIVKDFNGRCVDGKQLRMNISTPAPGTSIKDRVTGLPFSKLNQRRHRGNHKKWNKAKKKPQLDNSMISADVLDRQLDRYMKAGEGKPRNIKTREEAERAARGKDVEEEENEKKVIDADLDEPME